MEDLEIEVNGNKIKVVTKLPKEYIEDNNLKVFLDDTVDLKDVINQINLEENSEKVVEINNGDE